MNFIKVHNIEDGDLLINADKVTTIYPRSAGGAIVNCFDGSTAPTAETVGELAAMLLPGPERPKEAGPATICVGTETRCPTVESFLRTIRDGTSDECDRHGSCEACRHKEQSVVCWFRSLTDSEIRTIAGEYRRLRSLEQQEATNG